MRYVNSDLDTPVTPVSFHVAQSEEILVLFFPLRASQSTE